jgi:hypothetical protein
VSIVKIALIAVVAVMIVKLALSRFVPSLAAYI